MKYIHLSLQVHFFDIFIDDGKKICVPSIVTKLRVNGATGAPLKTNKGEAT